MDCAGRTVCAMQREVEGRDQKLLASSFRDHSVCQNSWGLHMLMYFCTTKKENEEESCYGSSPIRAAQCLSCSSLCSRQGESLDPRRLLKIKSWKNLRGMETAKPRGAARLWGSAAGQGQRQRHQHHFFKWRGEQTKRNKCDFLVTVWVGNSKTKHGFTPQDGRTVGAFIRVVFSPEV